MSKDDERGPEFERHTDHWRWYYDQQEQAICTLIAQSIALQEMSEEVSSALMREFRNRERLDAQREEVAGRLKMQKASSEYFADYKPKGYVMKKRVIFEGL